MGLGTLVSRGFTTILPSWFNEIRDALIGDFVPRGSSGAPEAGKNLGNALYPWGLIYGTGFVTDSGAIDPSQLETQAYKIVSGKVRATSNQPDFLRPAAASGVNFSILATATPLVLEIAGVPATWSADKNVAGTVGPSSNHTATVTTTVGVGAAFSRIVGEAGSAYHPLVSSYYTGRIWELGMGSAGANITAKVGTYQAFKVVSGGQTEYFLAFVESATLLTRAYRGFFSNYSGVPIKRSTITTGDTITLMNLGWVFLDADGTTVDTIYKNPAYGYTEPSSPATGDYWFDQSLQRWKRYNGSSFAIVDRVLVGLVVLDSTNCVAARSLDFFALRRSDNTIEVGPTSGSSPTPVIWGPALGGVVNVNGKRLSFAGVRDVLYTADAADRYNAAITASTTEFLYVTENGKFICSDIEPYDRPDLLGWYFPYHPWRCVGQIDINSGGNFDGSTLVSYHQTRAPQLGDKQVTRRKLEAVSESLSSSCGSFTTASTSQVDVTNLSITKNTTGRPVVIALVPSGSSDSYIGVNQPAGAGTYYASVEFLRDATVIFRTNVGGTYGAGTGLHRHALGFMTLDVPSAGSHTYKVRLVATPAVTDVRIVEGKLLVYEL